MILLHFLQVRQLREANKEPYAFSFARTHLAAALHDEHRDLPPGSVAELAAPVAVAGRVRARRVMGKLAFISIQDDSGQIQLYVDKKQLDAEQPGSFACVSSTPYAIRKHQNDQISTGSAGRLWDISSTKVLKSKLCLRRRTSKMFVRCWEVYVCGRL